jgi:type III pantothenate kinase
MLLAIDVGNSEMKLGVFDEGGTLTATWRLATRPWRTADEYGVTMTACFAASKIAAGDVSAIVVSSVVPVIERPLFEGCEKYFGVRPAAFTAATQTLIPIHTDRPHEVGADLIAAAVAARELVGSPAIAINFGTATTYGAVDRGGTYVGVAIAPGLQIAIDALAGRTAKLPQVALQAPGSPIGRETVSAIQAGLIYGTVGATEALVRRIRAEIGDEARVVASGGFAQVIAGETDVIERVEPHLVLYGLRAHHQAERR